ncbi:MAG: methionine gamma-lyase family protein, partial [Hydrogenoanaerobacterium sp.]
MTEQNFFDIDKKLMDIAQQAEQDCALHFAELDKTAEYNGLKVLAAFHKLGVSETHFAASTG